ncbi:MBL fold metallo-hydrolase [Actinomadura sp. 7K534]|uniref:MBL fold metallo-hydrolase n=1 Tax=Actinomadura sp. 7K534 TaxID=2530366 RepID=UPI00140501DC|nr:MBL fold metallo-hydrolase [Actinomadura sp. 7K534]
MDKPPLAERMAVRQVAPDVWAVPVPIPDNPLRYTVCYALEAPGGLVLLDPGWDGDATYEALSAGLATLGAAVGDVRGVVSTHFHPDHHGLAGRVRAESGAWVALHEADARFFGSDAAAVEAMVRTNETWLRAAGASVDEHPELADAGDEVVRRILLARPDVHPLDGDRLPGTGRLTVVHTPGHTPGHICLHDPDRRLLFGGDHLLPRISPNVGWHPMSGENPLGDFLASLDRVARLDPAAGLVLPAHEWPFTGPAARAKELIRHHDERLSEVKALLVPGPRTAWDLAQDLTWSRPWESLVPNLKRAALGEVLAHLVLLLSAGEVTRSTGSPQMWSLIQEEHA